MCSRLGIVRNFLKWVKNISEKTNRLQLMSYLNVEGRIFFPLEIRNNARVPIFIVSVKRYSGFLSSELRQEKYIKCIKDRREDSKPSQFVHMIVTENPREPENWLELELINSSRSQDTRLIYKKSIVFLCTIWKQLEKQTFQQKFIFRNWTKCLIFKYWKLEKLRTT